MNEVRGWESFVVLVVLALIMSLIIFSKRQSKKELIFRKISNILMDSKPRTIESIRDLLKSSGISLELHELYLYMRAFERQKKIEIEVKTYTIKKQHYRQRFCRLI